jgi:hypothetical protein
MENLEAQLEQHGDQFLSQYGHLDDDAQDSIVNAIGFVYEQPLIDFEQSLRINNTMRKSYEAAMKKWIDNEEFDTDTYPRNQYWYDYVDMALMTDLGEMKIGDSLFRVTPQGFYVVTDSNINTLMSLESASVNFSQFANVIAEVKTSLNANNCRKRGSKSYTHSYATNKKVICTVSHHVYPWNLISKAEITAYKKIIKESGKKIKFN